MIVQVVSSGLLTTVQDAGRFGFRALGVGSAGALYRAHPEAHPTADLGGFIRRLFPD